ncbi:MAG: tripartite tricarboxylate transporter permease [Pseudomonadota bacterium]
MDVILQALSLFLSVENILVIGIGVLIGTIIGAIPGMTTPMGVALALPFTFSMAPVTGILLLLGVYKGGLYGGSLSAILIKTPGTPAAACTVLDGYPLAQKGEARRALDIALYSSCIADFISNLALILFAGFLAAFALSFGPPEFFTLIVFSLTIIAGVSGPSLLKGIISACLGLMLATVGLDLIYGTPRFLFDEWQLMGGLSFIPVLIGLFALPEIIHRATRRPMPPGARRQNLGKGASLADLKRVLRSVFRGSIFGVILGAIPGIGGAPAAFLSYSEARRNSKNPENFGKGEIEGVAAAEAGNNGVAGATMIPLLALGIPGDVITAVILGAFMIHGLRPGPILFEQNQVMIYALFMGIMLSSLYLLGIGKLAIRFFSHLATVPNRILYPIVFVLCVFGAYAVNNTLFDVQVMLCMGVVGYMMLRLEVPVAPFLIAFVLGPLLEDNFRQSILIGDGDSTIFVRGPITIIFWCLTLMSLFVLIRARITAARTGRQSVLTSGG